MPAAIDRSGQVFGKLTVLREYTGPKPSHKDKKWWVCRCECGAEFPAATEHLAPSKGRRSIPLTGCSSCMQKTCPICGDKYDHTHPSEVCPKPSCKQQQASEYRAAYYMADREKFLEQSRVRFKNLTPEQLEQGRTRSHRYYERLKNTMTPEQRAKWREKNNASQRRWYNNLKTANPEHYKRIQFANRLVARARRANPQGLVEVREYQRNYARQLRAALRDDPQAYEHYKQQMNDFSREWYAKTIADPEKRAAYRAAVARRRNEREAQLFLADMQQIMETQNEQ